MTPEELTKTHENQNLSLSLEMTLQAHENDYKIRCRIVVPSDENISSKITNLGGFSRNNSFDNQLNH